MSVRFPFAAAASAALFAASLLSASRAEAVILYGVTATGRLVSFDSLAPANLLSDRAITGVVNTGGTAIPVVGADLRPADGKIYLVAKSGSTLFLFTLNPESGTATSLGVITDGVNPLSTSGTAFGVDFNPVADRLRIVSDAGENYRVNVSTLAAITDTALNPGSPDAQAAAYTNNYPGATTTTLFVIDATSDSLYTQNPPNGGVLNLVGSLGVTINGAAAFDIVTIGTGSDATNIAFAALQVGANGYSTLYTVNLSTGAATAVGNVGASGSELTLVGLTAARPPAPAPATAPLYRLYQPLAAAHILTADPAENDFLPSVGWVREGTVGRVYTTAAVIGTQTAVPLFRLYSSFDVSFVLTSDTRERDFLVSTGLYVNEGVVGYVLPAAADGTVPLFRVTLPDGSDHLLTGDIFELAFLANGFWRVEGLVGYVAAP
jgi:hypothetical protein